MEFDASTLVTIIGSVVAFLSGQRGVQYVQQRLGKTQESVPSPPSHWSEITGEHRPVLSSDCEARHAKLTEELQRGGDRFSELKDSIGGMREDMIGLRGDLRAGFASIPGDISKAAQAAVNRHEDRLHRG